MDEYLFRSFSNFPIGDFFSLHQKVLPQKKWSLESFSYFLHSPHAFCELATQPCGTLIGFILVQFVEDEGEILTFVVDPAFQNKGVGTQLLKNILRKGQKKCLKNMFLEVHEENLGAQKIYRKAGFKPIGKRVKYYSQKGDISANALTFCYFF